MRERQETRMGKFLTDLLENYIFRNLVIVFAVLALSEVKSTPVVNPLRVSG